MKIKVTQHDIDYGVRGEYSLCPIARAVKHKINGEVMVYGDDMSIFTTDIIRRYRYYKLPQNYKLPQKAKDFMQRFDDGKKVKPFTFEARKTK